MSKFTAKYTVDGTEANMAIIRSASAMEFMGDLVDEVVELRTILDRLTDALDKTADLLILMAEPKQQDDRPLRRIDI